MGGAEPLSPLQTERVELESAGKIYTLSDFLREAAEELEYVARLVEKKPATR